MPRQSPTGPTAEPETTEGLAVEPESETTEGPAAEPETTSKLGAVQSTSKASSKRKSSVKSTPKQHGQKNQTQAQTPEPETLVAPKPTAGAETVTQPTVVESEAMPEASQEIASTSKPATKRKSSSKTSTRGNGTKKS